MGKKYRVLHILRSSVFTGAEIVASEIIEMFKDSEIEMAYCSKDGQVREALEERNIKFFPVKYISISEIKRIVKIYQPDVIHAHDYTASILCAISVNCPIISHLHNNSSWIRKAGLKSSAFILSTLKYKKILTVSNSILDEYIFGRLIKRKTVMIGNPINISKIKEKASLPAVDMENYDIVFLGRLSKDKNPLRFIQIIRELSKSLPSIKVAMIGDGELLRECRKLIFDFSLKDTISVLGYINNPYPILKNSKILCLTSEWEGFGLVAVEALTLGCPVLCTNVGGLKDIVNDKCGKLCNSDWEFCDELYKLLTDAEYIDKKSEEAIQHSMYFDNIVSYREMLSRIYSEYTVKGIVL